MNGDCQYCAGGYYDCGPPASRCQPWDDPDEDRCHYIWILLRKKDDCCEARLWVRGAGDPPHGWTVFQRVPIRIQTNEIKDACVARIYVPQVDCSHYNKRCGDEDLSEGFDVEHGSKDVGAS